jgi:hypothetical protein
VAFVHRQNLKWVSFLLAFAFFWGISPLVAGASVKIDASDLLKIILDEAVKDNNKAENIPIPAKDSTNENSTDDLVELYQKGSSSVIMIHSAPSAKSKVLFKWEFQGNIYAETTPLVDKNDNSKWYKIILVGHYADFLRQIHKLAEFNYSYGYVNAKDVEINSNNDFVNKEMANIRAGRPPLKKVGGDFRTEAEGRSIRTLKVPVTLLEEPKDGAEKIKIPAGLKYVSYAPDTEDMFPVYYNDIDEVDWALIVRADTYKVLGWMRADEWHKIPWEKK